MNMPRTILIPNGDNIVHTFSDQEYLNRQQKLKNHMAQSNIDTVIFTSIHSINYYSDFLYCSFGRPYALVVTQDKVTSVTANIDGGQPFRRTFGENLVYTDWQKDSYFYALQQLAKNGGKIGIEYDHITKERLDKLHAAFDLSLIHISEPTRLLSISYAVFCLKKKKKNPRKNILTK